MKGKQLIDIVIIIAGVFVGYNVVVFIIKAITLR